MKGRTTVMTTAVVTLLFLWFVLTLPGYIDKAANDPENIELITDPSLFGLWIPAIFISGVLAILLTIYLIYGGCNA